MATLPLSFTRCLTVLLATALLIAGLPAPERLHAGVDVGAEPSEMSGVADLSGIGDDDEALAAPIAAGQALLEGQPALIFPESHAPGAPFRIWGRDAEVRVEDGRLIIERILRRPARASAPAGAFGPRAGTGLWLRRTGPGEADWTWPGPPEVLERERLTLRLVDADPAALEGMEPLPTRISFFRGHREHWRTGLPGYRALRMRQPWPGVDLVLRAEDGGLRAQLALQPGAALDRVAFELEGAGAGELEAASLDASGALRVDGSRGPLLRLGGAGSALAVERDTLVHPNVGIRPFGAGAAAFGAARSSGARGATTGGGRSSLEAADGRTLRLRSSGTVPAGQTRLADVGFVYAGVWGLPDFDRGLGIAVDGQGAAYLTGQAVVDGDQDAYVLKVDPSGSFIEYLSFVGGDAVDASFDIVVDAAGNSYFCGATSSPENSFPVVGGPQRVFGGVVDVLAASLDATGQDLRYAGYLGGRLGDFCEGVQVDGAGQLHLTGIVASSDYPAKVGPDTSHNGMADVFISKLTADPTAEDWQDNLVYSGFIGGSGQDAYVYSPPDAPEETWATAGHVTVDAEGAAYISGGTNSDEDSFPTGEGFGALPGPDQTFGGLWDAYAVKVLPDGSGLAYATYFGGAGEDLGFGMEVDAAGAAYFSGGGDSTVDSLGPVAGPGLEYGGGYLDIYAAKIAPDGGRFEYAGYLGSSGGEFATGMSLDAEGRLIAVGFVSEGEGFPIKGGPDDSYNSPPGDIGDAFVCRLVADPTTGSVIDNVDFCGYVGGTAFDQAFWVDVGPDGAVYVVGDTDSDAESFPDGGGMAGHPAPFTEFAGSTNAFVVKIAPADLPHPTAEPSATPSPAPSATPTDEPIGPPPTDEPTAEPTGPAGGWTLWIPRLDLRP